MALACEKSFPFDAELVNGEYDRTYLADDFARYFRELVYSGVFMRESTNLQVLANGDMTLTLKAGSAIIDGYRYQSTKDITITVPPADAVLQRIDRVSITWDKDDREIHYEYIEGTPAINPAAAELRRDAEHQDYIVAEIEVRAGVISITQTDITDTRLDSTICGLASPFAELDTTTLYVKLEEFYRSFVENTVNWQTQEKEEFMEWFDTLKDVLSGDVAGSLQLQIESLAEREFRHYMGLVNQTTEFLPDGSIVQESDKAVITTVTGYDEDNNKTITQTVEVKSDSSKYVKITTIIQATETENKRIVERYEAYGLAAYTYIAEFASSGGSTSSIASADTLGMVKVGQGLDISEDGTLSVNVETSAEKAASIVEKNMQDFTESEVEDIYDTAEDAQSDV